MSEVPDQTNYRELLSFVMHEVRRINAIIKDQSRLLSLAIKGERIDQDLIRTQISTIVEQSLDLSSWLAIVDLHVDPERFAKEPRHRVSLHEIFYKSIANLRRICREKHLNVPMAGYGKFYTEAHPIIDVVPYILLENSIKYSLPHGTVSVSLREAADSHEVRVSSVGPYVESDEIKKLFDVGYRGKHAREATPVGSGQGLYLVAAICESHEARMQVSSSGEIRYCNGIPYNSIYGFA